MIRFINYLNYSKISIKMSNTSSFMSNDKNRTIVNSGLTWILVINKHVVSKKHRVDKRIYHYQRISMVLGLWLARLWNVQSGRKGLALDCFEIWIKKQKLKIVSLYWLWGKKNFINGQKVHIANYIILIIRNYFIFKTHKSIIIWYSIYLKFTICFAICVNHFLDRKGFTPLRISFFNRGVVYKRYTINQNSWMQCFLWHIYVLFGFF